MRIIIAAGTTTGADSLSFRCAGDDDDQPAQRWRHIRSNETARAITTPQQSAPDGSLDKDAGLYLVA